ncbi:MAG: DUF4363 family protein [Clostridiales bacterium]|nr:DUF4363 family protein [Clostridiales bacterium]
MKTFVAILIALVIFLGLSIWNTIYLTRTSDELANQAEKVRAALSDEEWGDTDTEIKNLRQTWGKHKKTWLLLVEHSDIDSIDRTIFRVDELIRHKDKEQSLADLAELRFLVQDLADKEVLSLANIF